MTGNALADYLGALERAASSANVAEEAFRNEAVARIKALEQERAFAFRRLNLVRAVAAAVADAKEQPEAIARGASALLREINWTGATESQRKVVERFHPVILTLWQMHEPEPVEGEPPREKVETRPVDEELAAFEAWYAEGRNAPFLRLMEGEVVELRLSKSDPSGHEIFLFDEWVVHEFERTGGFTALIVLMEIGGFTVTPLRSTFLHVIGDEITWPQLSGLLASAGIKWDGVLLEAHAAAGGGPISDADAKAELRVLERRVLQDRSTINHGHFFDAWGRRLKVEEAQPQ